MDGWTDGCLFCYMVFHCHSSFSFWGNSGTEKGHLIFYVCFPGMSDCIINTHLMVEGNVMDVWCPFPLNSWNLCPSTLFCSWQKGKMTVLVMCLMYSCIQPFVLQAVPPRHRSGYSGSSNIDNAQPLSGNVHLLLTCSWAVKLSRWLVNLQFNHGSVLWVCYSDNNIWNTYSMINEANLLYRPTMIWLFVTFFI